MGNELLAREPGTLEAVADHAGKTIVKVVTTGKGRWTVGTLASRGAAAPVPVPRNTSR
jgi:hypothetical protein